MIENSKNYRNLRNYENVTRRIFDGVGQYNIPQLEPTQYEECSFIGFNRHKGCKDKDKKGIHFFLDDYQFIRIWNKVDQYVPLLQNYACVLTPDFSLYDEFPEALQIYNHFRKHWVGAYFQEHGIKVIPTISWCSHYSFGWCFDGEPVGGVVAVSSVGTQGSEITKDIFLMGYEEMINRLNPSTILFYGKVPKECKGNIIRIPAYQERFNSVEFI